MSTAESLAPRKMSEEEYLALPEEKPYLEYVCGEAIPKHMPDKSAYRLGKRIFKALLAYEEEHGGECGAEGRSRFPQQGYNDFRLPDYSYYAPARPADIPGSRFLAPPTLAVEIRSPDETLASQIRKCQYFRENGVDVCWLIDPVSRTAYIFEGEGDGEPVPFDGALESSLLPGFSLPVRELFAALD